MADKDIQDILNRAFDGTNNALKVSSSGTSSAGWGIPRTYATPRSTASTRSVSSANNAWYMRVFDSGTISKVALDPTTSNGNISIAAYTNSGAGDAATPTGGRLVTTGAIACPSTGYVEVSLGASVDVEEGDWFGLSADGTTAAFRSDSSSASASNLGKGIYGQQSTAHPCPATPVVAGWYRDGVYLLKGVA